MGSLRTLEIHWKEPKTSNDGLSLAAEFGGRNSKLPLDEETPKSAPYSPSGTPKRNNTEKAVTRTPSQQCRQKKDVLGFACLLHGLIRSARHGESKLSYIQAGPGSRAYRV